MASADLSDDALEFGLCYLASEKHTLSFGGDGSVQFITPRARDALNELLAAGMVVSDNHSDLALGCEYYRGKVEILPIFLQRGIGMPDTETDCFTWETFTQHRVESCSDHQKETR